MSEISIILPNAINIFLFVVTLILFVKYLIVPVLSLLAMKDPDPLNLTPELEDTLNKKIGKILNDWIIDEIDRTQLIITTTGFNYTFLGRLANLNFKAIGIVPEVEIELKNQLKDTEEIRSFSHFLDLVRTLYIGVDPRYLEILKNRYFISLSMILGPTPYTHTNKQLKQIKNDYPWLWILEAIASHSKVQNYNSKTSSIVTVDKTQQTEQGINIPQNDGIITL